MPDFIHPPDADDDVGVDVDLAAELEERCRDLEARVAAVNGSSARAFRVVASVVYRGGGYTLLLDTPDGPVVIDDDSTKIVATEVIYDLPGDETPASLRGRHAFLRRVGGLVLGGAVPVDVFDSAFEVR